MTQTIVVPKVGVVAFPPEMDAKSVNDAVRSLHNKAVIRSVLKFVAKDPALVGLDVADFYKQLSGIAAFLEKYPSLARAADAGIHGHLAHDLPTVEENGPVEPAEPEPAASPTEQTEETDEPPDASETEAEPAAEAEPAEAEPSK